MYITKENIVSLLLDFNQRKFILSKFIEESENCNFSLIKQITVAAREASFTSDDIIQLKNILFQEGGIGEDIFEKFIFNSEFPEKLLYELYNQDKFICTLAHRQGPIDLLLKIGREKAGYDEAILTVGHYYFDSEDISNEQFSQFLLEFINNHWLLSSLAHKAAYVNMCIKTSIFLEVLEHSKHNNKIRDLYHVLKTEKDLSNTTDVSFIKESFQKRNPLFLRAISCNPKTPENILLYLSEPI